MFALCEIVDRYKAGNALSARRQTDLLCRIDFYCVEGQWYLTHVGVASGNSAVKID